MRTRTTAAESLDTFSLRRHVNLWKIVRKDGVTYRFTEFNKTLVFDGESYSPVGGLNQDAVETNEGLDPMNSSFFGAFNTITYEDVQAGLFRDATLTQYIVDHQYPWLGYIYKNIFFIQGINFNGEGWRLEVSGPAYLLAREIGGYYTRNCRFQLGDTSCGVTKVTANSTVTVVDGLAAFKCANTFDNGDLEYGYVIWLTGNNAGIKSDIKSNTGTSIVLQVRTPFSITVGDTLTLVEGCDKNFSTCKDRFSNNVNFGGFPDILGVDRTLKADV